MKLIIFSFSNSLANSLGTETASLAELDGTASFFFKYLPQAVQMFLNFFSASARLNFSAIFVQQFNFLWLVFTCIILPNLLYEQSYFLNLFHGHHGIEEFGMHSGIAVDCCNH